MRFTLFVIFSILVIAVLRPFFDGGQPASGNVEVVQVPERDAEPYFDRVGFERVAAYIATEPTQSRVIAGEVPKPRPRPVHRTSISFDFSKLSQKWMHGVRRLVFSGKCDRFDALIREEARKHRLDEDVQKAHVVVESWCNPVAVGSNDDVGLFQTQKPACEDAKVEGDRKDPAVSVRCGVGYKAVLRDRYGVLDEDARIVAFNKGFGVVQKMTKEEILSHEYALKIRFVERLLRMRDKVS